MSSITDFFSKLQPDEYNNPISKWSMLPVALIWLAVGIVGAVIAHQRSRSLLWIAIGLFFAIYSVVETVLRHSSWRWVARAVLTAVWGVVMYVMLNPRV
jgi:hypothetical protein